MGKKKKNSNYVTAKTQQAKIDKENAKRAKRRKEILKLVLIPTVSLLLIAAIIVGLGFAFGWFYKNTSHRLGNLRTPWQKKGYGVLPYPF